VGCDSSTPSNPEKRSGHRSRGLIIGTWPTTSMDSIFQAGQAEQELGAPGERDVTWSSPRGYQGRRLHRLASSQKLAGCGHAQPDESVLAGAALGNLGPGSRARLLMDRGPPTFGAQGEGSAPPTRSVLIPGPLARHLGPPVEQVRGAGTGDRPERHLRRRIAGRATHMTPGYAGRRGR